MKKVLRFIVFIIAALLFIWFLAPIYKGVVHIGMLYPLPILALFMLFSAKPDLLKYVFTKFKVLSIVINSFIGVGIIVFVSLVGVMVYYAKDTPQANSTVIILGCQVNGTRPSLMLYDRMMAAVDYLNENPDSAVIASGGKGPGESISEAQAIKTFLVNKGVDESRIYLEDKSVNTNQNITFSAKIIEENRLNKNVAVVTDGFHQFRSAYFAKQNNLDSSAISCHTRWYFAPSYYSREVLAIFKMIFL